MTSGSRAMIDGMRVILGDCIAYTWRHSMELRMHLDREEPIAGSVWTHTVLRFSSGLPLLTFDPEAAAGKALVTEMAFTGKGGGAWTVIVSDYMSSVTEGGAANSDIVVTQNPDIFVNGFLSVTDTMTVMQDNQAQGQGRKHDDLRRNAPYTGLGK